MGKTSDAANGVSAALEQARDKLNESGAATAATATQVKDQVLATAVTAKDKALDAAKDVADQLPGNQQELEAAVRSLVDNIRRNPRPWVIGATVAGVIWLLGRSSKR